MASIEIETNGLVVWVNGWDGCCWGRFSKDGIDVHKTAAEQMNGGTPCLDCTHGLPFDESWERFKLSMLKFHNVAIDDSWKPTGKLRKHGIRKRTARVAGSNESLCRVAIERPVMNGRRRLIPQRLINRTVKCANDYRDAERALMRVCVEIYGIDPGEIAADEIIDSVMGGIGMSTGMTAKRFDEVMRYYVARATRIYQPPRPHFGHVQIPCHQLPSPQARGNLRLNPRA